MPRIVPVARRALAGIAVLVAASLVPPAISETPAAAHPRKSDACGVAVPKKGGARWTCTFVDNFDGSTLDTSKWTVQHTADTGFRTERTCYQDDPSNVAVRDGALVLTARKGRWVNCRFRARWMSTRFTGGMVGTRDRFTQAYGRFEVRARFPDTDHAGLHGGFWMYPPDETYGDWPSSGEIDVAEWWSYKPTLVLPSLHYDTDDPDVDSGWDCAVADASVFHTYTLVWEPTSIRFLIDGSPCFTRTPTPDAPLVAPQPFDRPFGMVLNMGVAMNGLSWRTQFPASLVVDYARAWR